MFLFGHVGLTLATANIADVISSQVDTDKPQKGLRARFAALVRKFRNADGVIDYRLVIIGSMLPDIVDKPLSLLAGDSPFIAGRGFTHSLTVIGVFLILGFVIRKPWLLTLSAAGLMHLLLDGIWAQPVAMFWPFLGLEFPPCDYEYWLSHIWEALLKAQDVLIPELAGLIICVFLGLRILRRGGINAFLRKGIIR